MLRLIVATSVLASVGTAYAGELPRAIGMYTPANTQLALVDSKIEVVVRGPIVEAVVTQKFVNKTDRATEATYVFPLPVDAAVSAMSIETGTKKIHASIERREQAQQRYEAAVRAGVAGALLDQERSDVFTQTVAAVPAKGTVAITLRFDTVARFQDGTWELALPLVVAPRYVPGVATNRPTTGTGRAPDTDRSPDASRITPGGSPGAGGATNVVLSFTDKITDLTSPTHELKIGAAESTFVDPKTDHDAIIRWKTVASAGGWVESASDGGYAAIVVEAPAAAPRRSTLRWTLMLDRSAASRGDAEATARPLVRGLFAAMTGSDRVAVTGSDQIAWGIGTDVGRLVEDRWSLNAGAFDLTRSLAQARPEGMPVLLISGGLVADDRAALAAAVKLGVPVHVIGVGPAPARGVLSQIAASTGGTVRYAIPGDDLAALAKATLADLATTPAPLSVTWGTLQASDVVPGTLPRLGAGQAIVVLARVRRAVVANGRARGELFSIDALPPRKPLEGATTPMGPLARRWGRNRLDELIASRASGEVVAAHAIRYGLVSPYTSMVAIGDEVIVQGGVKRSVAVPVSVPAGMKWQQVKKETTVDRNVVGRGQEKEKDGKDAGGDRFAKKPDVAPTSPRKPADPIATRTGSTSPNADPKPQPKKPATKAERPDATTGAKRPPPVAPAQNTKLDEDYTKNIPTGGAPAPADEAADKPSKKRKPARDDDAEEQLDAAGAEDGLRSAPTSISALDFAGSDGEAIETVSASGRRKRWRIAAGIGGGLVRSGGDSSSLLTAGARLELRVGRRALAGVDSALWLVDGEARGQVLVSAATLVTRWLELGFGTGLQFGEGTGPAASLSLRYHFPFAPHGALFLRYDGSFLYRDDARRGQSSGTAGLEWSF